MENQVKNQKICFVSVDIEGDLEHGDDKTFESVYAVKNLLRVFKQYQVAATLFVSGIIIEKFPNIVKEWARDFEIGSHNYTHDSLTDLSNEERVLQLEKFVDIYKRILGKSCAGFRAPRHLIDNNELELLQKNGFIYDSSVIPAYVPFKKYPGYKGSASTAPYRPDSNDYLKAGRMNILELPLTPVLGGLPFSGTWLRYFNPNLFKFLLFFRKPKFLSFMMHSWDAMEFTGHRSKNSGRIYLAQLEAMLNYLKKAGYQFKNGQQIVNEF